MTLLALLAFTMMAIAPDAAEARLRHAATSIIGSRPSTHMRSQTIVARRSLSRARPRTCRAAPCFRRLFLQWEGVQERVRRRRPRRLWTEHHVARTLRCSEVDAVSVAPVPVRQVRAPMERLQNHPRRAREAKLSPGARAGRPGPVIAIRRYPGPRPQRGGHRDPRTQEAGAQAGFICS